MKIFIYILIFVFLILSILAYLIVFGSNVNKTDEYRINEDIEQQKNLSRQNNGGKKKWIKKLLH